MKYGATEFMRSFFLGLSQKIIRTKISLSEETLEAILPTLSASYKLLARRGNKPLVKFIIFTPGRAGSEVLRALLNCHPQVHCDGEILGHRVLFPVFFVKAQYLLSHKTVYGFKLKYDHLLHHQKIRHPAHLLNNWHAGGWKIIYLFRKNILRQTLSYMLAGFKNEWHLTEKNARSKIEKIRVNCNILLLRLRAYEKYKAQEERCLSNLSRLRFSYEEAILSESNHQKTADEIFSYLNLRSVPAKTSFLRTTPENLDAFIENHEEVLRTLKASEFAHYLTEPNSR